MYDADVSASLISKVTDAVIEQVTEWQNRTLDSLYQRWSHLFEQLKAYL